MLYPPCQAAAMFNISLVRVCGSLNDRNHTTRLALIDFWCIDLRSWLAFTISLAKKGISSLLV